MNKNNEHRVAIKFYFKIDKSETEMLKTLKMIYSGSIVFRTTTVFW